MEIFLHGWQSLKQMISSCTQERHYNSIQRAGRFQEYLRAAMSGQFMSAETPYFLTQDALATRARTPSTSW